MRDLSWVREQGELTTAQSTDTGETDAWRFHR